MERSVVPTSLFAAPLPKHCPPEYSLLAAVMEEAVRDILSDTWGRIKHKESAVAWMFHGSLDDDTPFSFAWICDMLNFSPLKLRENVRRLIRDKFDTRDARQMHRTLSGIAASLHEAAL